MASPQQSFRLTLMPGLQAAKLIEFLDKDLDGHIGFDEFEKYYEQKAAEAAEYQKVQAALGKTVENKLNLGKEVKDIEGEDWESKIVERIFTGQWVEEVDPALPQLVSPTLTHRVGDFVAGGSDFQHVGSGQDRPHHCEERAGSSRVHRVPRRLPSGFSASQPPH